MRSRRHQQDIPGLAQTFTHLVSLGLLHLGSEHRRRHFVRLVEDDQIPVNVTRLVQNPVAVAREDVQTGKPQTTPCERIPALIDQVLGEYLEGQAKFLGHLVRPLVHQRPGGDDKDIGGIPPHDQLLDQQSRHDRLTSAGVVREDEPQRMPRQHFLVHGTQLVRQRVHIRGPQGGLWIEKMR